MYKGGWWLSKYICIYIHLLNLRLGGEGVGGRGEEEMLF